MKKWNWEAFAMLMLLSGLGFGTNKSIDTLSEWVLAWLCIGLPISLIAAYSLKEDDIAG